MITEGTVAFCHLVETEKYQGQDTERFTITINLSSEDADKLKDMGIRLKDWDGKAQRKFVTKFSEFPVVDSDGEPTSKHIPYNSKVRIQWEPGKPHPTHGVAPYLRKVKVLELAVDESSDEEGF